VVCIVIEKAIKDCFEVNVLTRKGMIINSLQGSNNQVNVRPGVLWVSDDGATGWPNLVTQDQGRGVADR
jgi:hypothetical protein